ncbi:MAG: hypothetical protein LBJ57_01990 [Prevotellaceae bacterium]|jgi:hypothetical protein|nr:hypothetical protein [Prevotellaceae bacterium]
MKYSLFQKIHRIRAQESSSVSGNNGGGVWGSIEIASKKASFGNFIYLCYIEKYFQE